MTAARPCSISSFPNRKSAVRPVEVPDLRRAFEAVLRERARFAEAADGFLWPVILTVSREFPPHTAVDQISALVYRVIALMRVLQMPAPVAWVDKVRGDLNSETFQRLLKAAAEVRMLDHVEFEPREFWALVGTTG